MAVVERALYVFPKQLSLDDSLLDVLNTLNLKISIVPGITIAIINAMISTEPPVINPKYWLNVSSLIPKWRAIISGKTGIKKNDTIQGMRQNITKSNDLESMLFIFTGVI